MRTPPLADDLSRWACVAHTQARCCCSGETTITGNQPFTQRHASFEDEIAAAAKEGSKGEKRRMNYGDEIEGELDPKKVAKEAKRLKKAAKRAEAEQDERKKKYNSFSTVSSQSPMIPGALWAGLLGCIAVASQQAMILRPGPPCLDHFSDNPARSCLSFGCVLLR